METEKSVLWYIKSFIYFIFIATILLLEITLMSLVVVIVSGGDFLVMAPLRFFQAISSYWKKSTG